MNNGYKGKYIGFKGMLRGLEFGYYFRKGVLPLLVLTAFGLWFPVLLSMAPIAIVCVALAVVYVAVVGYALGRVFGSKGIK